MGKPAFTESHAIHASITARSLSDHACGMAMNLALESGYGVYADAARHDLTQIEAEVAKLKADLEKMPSAKAVAA